MNPLVSVIIPTKNSARTLRTCIESIRRQSYDHIEIIVVDNESSDTTIDIAQKGGARIAQEQNERSAQRNKGAFVSRGEYIVFIDSDMKLSKSVIQECVEGMEQAPYIQAIVIPEKSFGYGFWAACKTFERSFYTETPWMRAVRFFKRSSYEAIRGFDSSMIAGEDFDIHNRIKKTFGTQAIGTISAEILHNEGDLSLNALMRKKFYYGGHIRQYRDKAYNKHAYRKQATMEHRFMLFTSHPKKILLHPIIFLGTVY